MADTRRALTPNGTLLSNGGGHAGGKLGRVIRAMLVSIVVRQQAQPSVKTQNRADLVALKALVEAGKVMPVVGGTYRLEQTAEAIGHVAAGHARGTLVVSVRPSAEENRMPTTRQARNANAESEAARVAVAS
jgi:NADPH:quinone reductase-like Zn-dependent oxidoreductase